MWDKERNSHLFTAAALDTSQKLLDLLADFSMVQTLPKDMPTLQSSSTGNWTRPDNMFCMDHSEEIVVSCTMDPGQRGPKTDHIPVLTELNLEVPVVHLSEGSGQNNQQPTPNDNKREWWSSSVVLVYDLHRGMCCKPAGKVQEGREGLLMGKECD